MRPGFSVSDRPIAAAVGLDLSALFAPGGGKSAVRSGAATDTVRSAVSGGVRRFSGPEGAEVLVGLAPSSTFTLQLAPGFDLGRRIQSARESLNSAHGLELALSGAALVAGGGDDFWRQARRLSDGVPLGVTVRPGGDPLGVARRFKPDFMELSVSLLDQRLIHSDALAEVAATGVEVRLRTAMLRSLLFLPREGLPLPLADAGPQVSRVRRVIAEAGADPLQAAVGFALSRPEAAVVIVEAASVGEVRALLAAAAAPLPQLDWAALALHHPAALDAEADLYRRVAA